MPTDRRSAPRRASRLLRVSAGRQMRHHARVHLTGTCHPVVRGHKRVCLTGVRGEPLQDVDCVLWGGYGWGNAGDELTLAVALQDVRARTGSRLAILTPAPGYTSALFPGVRVIAYRPLAARRGKTPISRLARAFSRAARGRYEVRDQFTPDDHESWARIIGDSGFLYLVGGGYLNDLFDLDYFLLPALVARHSGVRIESAPLGVGPFKGRSGTRRFQATFRDVGLTVRDESSLVACTSLGVPATLARDDGFRAAEVLPGVVERRRLEAAVGVNLHAQAGGAGTSASKRWWRDLLGELQSRRIRTEGFCFHNAPLDDFSATAEAFASAGLDPALVRHPCLDFREACAQVGRYRTIISTRFHAVVTANVLKVPALAVADGAYYQTKMHAACTGHVDAGVADIRILAPGQAALWISERYSAYGNAG